MTADKYLDSSRVIRELEDAERNHQADEQAVLDELKRAAAHCDRLGEDHQRQANAYMMARAAYFAEIHRRVSLPRGASAARLSPTYPRVGVKRWCRENGVSLGVLNQFVRMSRATDQVAYLEKIRVTANNRFKESRKENRLAARGVGLKDPLRQLKITWHKLSPVQREAAIEWLFEVAPWIWQEKAA